MVRAIRPTSMWRAFFVVSGLVLLPSASSHAASFDGAWSVLQVCNSTQEGARGYTWRYDANGHLVGQYRSPSSTCTAERRLPSRLAIVCVASMSSRF